MRVPEIGMASSECFQQLLLWHRISWFLKSSLASLSFCIFWCYLPMAQLFSKHQLTSALVLSAEIIQSQRSNPLQKQQLQEINHQLSKTNLVPSFLSAWFKESWYYILLMIELFLDQLYLKMDLSVIYGRGQGTLRLQLVNNLGQTGSIPQLIPRSLVSQCISGPQNMHRIFLLKTPISGRGGGGQVKHYQSSFNMTLTHCMGMHAYDQF